MVFLVVLVVAVVVVGLGKGAATAPRLRPARRRRIAGILSGDQPPAERTPLVQIEQLAARARDPDDAELALIGCGITVNGGLRRLRRHRRTPRVTGVTRCRLVAG